MVITRSPPMTRQRALNMRFGDAQQDQRADDAADDQQNQHNPVSPARETPQNQDLNEDVVSSNNDDGSDQQFRDKLLCVDMDPASGNGVVGDDDAGGQVLEQQNNGGEQQLIGNNEMFLQNENREIDVRIQRNEEIYRNHENFWTLNDSLTGSALGLPSAQPPLEATPQTENPDVFFRNNFHQPAQMMGNSGSKQNVEVLAHAKQRQSLISGNPKPQLIRPAPIYQQQMGFAQQRITVNSAPIQNANRNSAPIQHQNANPRNFNGYPNPPPGFMWSLVPLNSNAGPNAQNVGSNNAGNRHFTRQRHTRGSFSDDEVDEFGDAWRMHGRRSAQEEHRVRFPDHHGSRMENRNRHQDFLSAQAIKSLDSFSYTMVMNTLPSLKGNIGIDAVKNFFKQFDVATEEWPDRKRLSALESKCSGRAERAFNAAVADNPYRYESIKRAMIRQLEETDAKQMGAFDELMAGIQRRANESIDDLADRVAALVQCAYPGLTQHLYDEYSVKHLIRSLGNPELALSLELNRRPGCSLDEFVALAARAEATQRAARNTTYFWPKTPKNAKHFAPSNYPDARSSFGFQVDYDRPEIVCYNCGQPGHLSRHCELPRKDHQGAASQNFNMNTPSMGANSTSFSSGSQQNKPQMSSRNILRQNFLVDQDVAPSAMDDSEISSEMTELFNKANKKKEVLSAELEKAKGPLIGKPMEVKVSVYGESTNAMLDGGAQISLISAAFYLRLMREGKVDKNTMGLSDSGRRVVDINGQNLDYFGVVSVPISRGSQFARVRMHVTMAPFGYDLLFGTNAFDQLGFKLFDALNQKIIDFKGVNADESNQSTAHVIYSVKLSPVIRPCGKEMTALIPNLEPSYVTIEEHKKAKKRERRRRQRERRKLRKGKNSQSNSGKREEEERKNGNSKVDTGIVTSRLRTIEFSGGGVVAVMPIRPDDRERVRTVRGKASFARGRAGLSLCDFPCQRADLDLGYRLLPSFASHRSDLGLGDRRVSHWPRETRVPLALDLTQPRPFRMPNRA